jgi:hypothetical protein
MIIKTYSWPERTHFNCRPIQYYEDENGCWICISHTINRSHGYPELIINGKFGAMHHHIWEYEHGRKVGKGMVVRHTCNNRTCINPAHLKRGTVKQNHQDAIKAGTHTCLHHKGENHGSAKLTQKDVRYIFLNPDKLLQRELAELFNVGHVAIHNIQKGKRWQSVTRYWKP